MHLKMLQLLEDINMLITRNQYDLLHGFFIHCYAVYHQQSQEYFSFWAEQLDKEQIPWSIQNIVAVTAESKESISLYLSTHLKSRDISVS